MFGHRRRPGCHCPCPSPVSVSLTLQLLVADGPGGPGGTRRSIRNCPACPRRAKRSNGPILTAPPADGPGAGFPVNTAHGAHLDLQDDSFTSTEMDMDADLDQSDLDQSDLDQLDVDQDALAYLLADIQDGYGDRLPVPA